MNGVIKGKATILLQIFLFFNCLYFDLLKKILIVFGKEYLYSS